MTSSLNKVHRLRAEYEILREQTSLFPPSGKPILDVHCQPGERSSVTIWYEDGTEVGQCVRIFDIPGTLSGDILRLHQNLPP
jgi:hypothetical protein